MRRGFIWVLTNLIVGGLLGTASISLAAGDTWTQKADMPTARAFLSTSVVDGKIYAIGGYHLPAAQVPAPITLTVEEYNPATDTWTKKTDMPTAMGWFSTSVVGGKIYVIGGFGSSWGPLRTVEEYDPATDTWTRKADMPTARGGFSTSVVNGKIYAIGGEIVVHDGQPILTVAEYDPGFVPQSTEVSPQGKLATTWGEIKKF